MSRADRWMAGSATLTLLAIGGLCALGSITYAPPQPNFSIVFFLYLVFEIGCATLTTSFNCWINLKLTRLQPPGSESLAEESKLILPWPEQQMESTEQYA